MIDEPDYRALPRIDALVSAASDLVAQYGAPATTAALRTAVDSARTQLAAGARPPDSDALVAVAAGALERGLSAPPRAVINATGVIIHTNLGRASLSPDAVAAVQEAAGYCDVEYDLETGTRGTRTQRLEPLLQAVTGAEAGLGVNNAAAALVLALAALAGGRDVLVSRGELVEIGGSFRLPDIMRAAGVRLVEVGTTNRTRPADYDRDGAALLLKVHPSNYRMTGFTESATVAELAEIARHRQIPLVFDVGSGLLEPRREPWLASEPSVRGALSDGADLVLCSGDKLLGGPQAGLLVGNADLVATCAAHPLARALRLDKLRLAALVATLHAHARDTHESLPVWSALLAPAEDLRDRLASICDAIGMGEIVESASVIGGGAAPGSQIPTPVLHLALPHAEAVAQRLRGATPPVIVRVADGAVHVDVRTVPADADAVLVTALRAAVAADG